MSVTVRFAPSPTGRLHVGNARLAVVNWLWARRAGGTFLLRLDDTDTERSTPAFAAGIVTDLSWLGLTWDQSFRQSDRLGLYAAAVERLKAAGRLYPCYETAEELDLKRRRQLARHLPPVYDRAALALSAAERAAREAQGQQPHWRFRLEPGVVAWDDLIHGPCHIDPAALSDPVLLREDGRPLYTLCSVVDDLDCGVTHIIRGEDHLTNTVAQIQLFQALGGIVPAFAHLSLMTDAQGQGLSKRLGSLSLESLRVEEGLEPQALASLLARLGSADAVEPLPSLEALAEGFDLGHFSRAPVRFDLEDLRRLNARLLHRLPLEAVAPRLEALGCPGVDTAFWHTVRPNLTRLDEARIWWQITHAPVAPVLDDPALTTAAAALLPSEPWDENTWSQWTRAVTAATGAKGKALFLPLRRALTGQDHGPELRHLLPLLGRSRAEARLGGERA